MKTKHLLCWLLVSLLVVFIDQWTKFYMVHHFVPGMPYYVLPVFNLTLSFNPGAAFSFLADMGGAQIWILSGVAILVSLMLMGWLYRTSPHLVGRCLGLSLILGGAVGNLIDRLRFGFVIDFFQFHAAGWYFAIFNVADSAVTVGAVLLMISLISYRDGDLKE
jgi:signal peptidase II